MSNGNNGSNGGRALWASKLGFILAASGSAIGLGNVWKFPYIAGQNGGGAFVAVFLLCIAFVGLPLLLAEFIVGKKTQLNPAGAFRLLRPRSQWVWVGYMGVVAGILILSYYSVVGGWTLAYIVKSALGEVTRFGNAADAAALFGRFIADPVEIVVYHGLFMGATVAIVIGGVNNGIERACNLMMPSLAIILLILIARSLTLPGAWEGVKFFLVPDFSKINAQAVLLALGHAFFSLSLGMGCMITYGSYLSGEESLSGATIYIVVFDTLVGILSGLIIFPAVFSMNMPPAEGPSLVFNILPVVFSRLPFGALFSCIFFVLLAIAAITSAISLLEVVVAYFVDELRWPRRTAVWSMGAAIFLLGVPSALSFGMWKDGKIGGLAIFDAVDFLAANIMLPLGGLFTAVFVGWVWGGRDMREEIERHEGRIHYTRFCFLSLRYIVPVGVAAILLARIL